jgi:hypothetical protein
MKEEQERRINTIYEYIDSGNYQYRSSVDPGKNSSSRVDNIDYIVDRVLTQYSKKHKICSEVKKRLPLREILAISFALLVVLAMFPYVLPPLHGDFSSDVSVSLYPENVLNNDTMFVNVTIPEFYNITSVTADMAGIESVNLSLVDNSTSLHMWQSIWIAHDVITGEHIVTISALDEDNISYYAGVRWSVLPNETTDDGINETPPDVEIPGKPYDIFEIPENSFGAPSTKLVNMSYFWKFFNRYNSWRLEAWDVENNSWMNASKYMNIIRSRSENNQFEKISIEFTAPLTTDYRLTFVIDRPVIEFINRSDQYEYELTYTISENEEYSTFFNFSDIASIPGVIISHGIENMNGVNTFRFSAQQNHIPQGTSVVLDPTFGNNATSTLKTAIEDYIKGGYFQMGSFSGIGDNITAYLTLAGEPKNAKCALYDSALNLVANSMTQQLSFSDGWNTFNFNTTKPVLQANAWYYIVIWSSASGGQGYLNYAESGGYGIFSDSETYSPGDYSGFPTPFENTTVDGDGLASIYCSYTELINTSVDAISPYNISSSPYTINATNITAVDNVTLWYRYSDDNSSWGSWIENTTDTNSPWQWSFGFPNSTGYYEFYSIGKKSGSADETPPGSADAKCLYMPVNVSPSMWDIGSINLGDNASTSGFYFNFTNDGNKSIDVQIKASNATNSTTGLIWNLTASPGHNNFSLQYNKSGVGTWTNINTTFDTFVANLGADSYQTFDLKIFMATTASSLDPLSLTITFKSVVS